LSIQCVMRPFAVLVFLGCLSFPSSAQTEPPKAEPPASSSQTSGTPGQTAPAPTDKNNDKEAQASGNQGSTGQGKVEGTSNDRLFFALPNFLTLEGAGKVPPLTSGQKFRVVLRSSFDYIQIPWYGFLSGISQAENSEPGYGQGAEGYAKRFGAAFADGTIENFMVGAVFPSLLRQDPRYFQLGHGGFVHRTSYAISRSFVTRSDSGHPQFNFSEIVGGMVAAAVSTNTYHPKSFTTVRYSATGTPTYVFTASDRTLDNTAKVWGTQLGYDTLTLVVKEFWPDIHRRLSHKHSPGEGLPAGNSHP